MTLICVLNECHGMYIVSGIYNIGVILSEGDGSEAYPYAFEIITPDGALHAMVTPLSISLTLYIYYM